MRIVSVDMARDRQMTRSAVCLSRSHIARSATRPSVFDRRVGDQVLDFGTTGKLRKSDLVMWDRQTESWWQQFLGEAIVGEMTGTQLKIIPSRNGIF